MKQKTIAQTKRRMIHIRLDDKTHRALKILAAKSDTTIQSIVEELIERKLAQEPGALKSADKARGRG